ncbi:LGFP repeat-containing protein, partial [Leucobacter sp. BZR 635]
MSDFLSPPAQRSGVVRGSLTRALRVLAMGVGAVLLAAALVAPATPAEAANPSNGFQPGNIISDGKFYDGNAMSVAEVQSFLNKQVPSCWLGRPGYEVGKPVSWNGPTKLASKCLRDFRINTSTELANPYCAAIPGQKNESAASVIVRVGKACGISPKVLLVMLDKEQSLVSDPWPNENQYFYAMGYACPDSGPGGAANCDASRGGFAKQVYRAAWQFKVYRAFPNSYRYRPFQANTIQWHPNAGCGTSQVRIDGYATAALYIYTPYRPNQAALNAGWGTGDACSSYGNRNFYNYYNAWFENPVLKVDSRFTALHKEIKPTLGDIVENATAVSGGFRQNVEKGSMYWHPKTGAQVVKGGIRTYYNSLGAASSILGFPLAKERQISGGYYQEFQGGLISYASATKRYVIRGSIREHFLAVGGFNRAGLAQGLEQKVGSGYYQVFDKGWITSLHGYGRSFVTGKILDKYKALGGPAALGFPKASAQTHASGQWQLFEKSTLYLSANGTVIPVRGSIRNQQMASGGVGVTGFPLAGERQLADGTWAQEFERGTVVWKNPNGAFLTPGKVRDYVRANGLGSLGKQVGKSVTSAAGEMQEFSGSTLYWSAEHGYVPVRGSVRVYQVSVGGVGVTGFPLAGERQLADGTWAQEF